MALKKTTKKLPTLKQIEYEQSYCLCVDMYTGIIYITNNKYESGGMTVMLNVDGTPRTYEQFIRDQQVHKRIRLE